MNCAALLDSAQRRGLYEVLGEPDPVSDWYGVQRLFASTSLRSSNWSGVASIRSAVSLGTVFGRACVR
jgi:hypothetical protein